MQSFDDDLNQIAAGHHGLIAKHHLLELEASPGLPHERIAAGRWEPLHEGVYRIAGVPITWHAVLLAACWAGGTRAVASHTSAAALWGLPSGGTAIVEITCPRWRRSRHDGVTVHETKLIDDGDRACVDQIPCTTAERTLFDLARRTRPVMLDANVDAALRRGLVTLDSLVATVGRLATQGRPGGKRFRAVVEARLDGRPAAESVAERRLADMLVRHGLPEPVLQYEIRDWYGNFVARVDLAYPGLKLAIEYDSLEHHVGKLALLRDSARRNALTELGYLVLTATVADLRDHGARLAASVRRIRDRAA